MPSTSNTIRGRVFGMMQRRQCWMDRPAVVIGACMSDPDGQPGIVEVALGAPDAGFREMVDVGGAYRRGASLAERLDEMLPVAGAAGDEHGNRHGVGDAAVQLVVVA